MRTKLKKIVEGSATIVVPDSKKISSEMKVFYNPVMKLNRDISIEVLKNIPKKRLRILDLLAATGVRSIRFLLELKKKKIDSLMINDCSKDAVKLIKKNLLLNKIKFRELKDKKVDKTIKMSDRVMTKKIMIDKVMNKRMTTDRVIVSNREANKLLVESNGFDYIDIDPFGSPNQFADNTIKRISRGGILAITATDTASLSGTFPKTCLRKYYSKPLRNAFMHETGLRIVIRKLQLIGAQYERALIPIFSYYHQHYFRVFFRCEKAKKMADEIISKHGFILYCRKCLHAETTEKIFNSQKCRCGADLDFAGPLWLGSLWDTELLENILKNLRKKSEGSEKKRELIGLITTCFSESKIKIPWFYNLGELCKRNKISAPKKKILISALRRKGLSASQTHFDAEGIRTSATPKEIAEIMKRVIDE